MFTRHMNELNARLEQVADVGCAVVRKQELLRWHDKEKLMKSVWKSVHDKWIEIDAEAPLLIGDGDGIVTLAFGAGLKPTSESWFKDIRQWAGVEADDEEW
jgi:hypothetical protein